MIGPRAVSGLIPSDFMAVTLLPSVLGLPPSTPLVFAVFAVPLLSVPTVSNNDPLLPLAVPVVSGPIPLVLGPVAFPTALAIGLPSL